MRLKALKDYSFLPFGITECTDERKSVSEKATTLEALPKIQPGGLRTPPVPKAMAARVERSGWIQFRRNEEDLMFPHIFKLKHRPWLKK